MVLFSTFDADPTPAHDHCARTRDILLTDEWGHLTIVRGEYSCYVYDEGSILHIVQSIAMKHCDFFFVITRHRQLGIADERYPRTDLVLYRCRKDTVDGRM